MKYVLCKPYGVEAQWTETPYKHKADAAAKVRQLLAIKKPDGTQMFNVRLCVGKGRDRRTFLDF